MNDAATVTVVLKPHDPSEDEQSRVRQPSHLSKLLSSIKSATTYKLLLASVGSVVFVVGIGAALFSSSSKDSSGRVQNSKSATLKESLSRPKMGSSVLTRSSHHSNSPLSLLASFLTRRWPVVLGVGGVTVAAIITLSVLLYVLGPWRTASAVDGHGEAENGGGSKTDDKNGKNDAGRQSEQPSYTWAYITGGVLSFVIIVIIVVVVCCCFFNRNRPNSTSHEKSKPSVTLSDEDFEMCLRMKLAIMQITILTECPDSAKSIAKNSINSLRNPPQLVKIIDFFVNEKEVFMGHGC
jgi:hypothetical protein